MPTMHFKGKTYAQNYHLAVKCPIFGSIKIAPISIVETPCWVHKSKIKKEKNENNPTVYSVYMPIDGYWL